MEYENHIFYLAGLVWKREKKKKKNVEKYSLLLCFILCTHIHTRTNVCSNIFQFHINTNSISIVFDIRVSFSVIVSALLLVKPFYFPIVCECFNGYYIISFRLHFMDSIELTATAFVYDLRVHAEFGVGFALNWWTIAFLVIWKRV